MRSAGDLSTSSSVDNLRTVVAIIPSFLDVFLLALVFLFFSSWIAYVLFEDTVQVMIEPLSAFKFSYSIPMVMVGQYAHSKDTC